MTARIDLNVDLGELPGETGAQLDAALLDVVTSANIACGGHAGDEDSMRRVARGAAQRGIAIGAHISYPDREYFGRRDVAYTPQALLDALRIQIDDLLAATADAGTGVAYLKPHGALYNAAVINDAPAALLVEVAQHYGLPLLTQPDGRLAQCAAGAGVPVYGEFFADRAYEATGRLRSRSRPGAVITRVDAVRERVLTAVVEQCVVSHDGTRLAMQVDSVCLHGDTAGAVALARAVRESLVAASLTLRPFIEAAA